MRVRLVIPKESSGREKIINRGKAGVFHVQKNMELASAIRPASA